MYLGLYAYENHPATHNHQLKFRGMHLTLQPHIQIPAIFTIHRLDYPFAPDTVERTLNRQSEKLLQSWL